MFLYSMAAVFFVQPLVARKCKVNLRRQSREQERQGGSKTNVPLQAVFCANNK
jgi:hypothetical protein